MGRSPCCEKIGLKRGPWSPEEDQKLMDYIQKNGYGNWRTLPKNAGLQRCGKSCRLRWTNYLRPDIKRGKFSFEEEETIIQLHSMLGNKWSTIAAQLPGRTDNEIKNYWNTRIRKRLLRMGIDPVTHSPRLDLLDWSAVLNSPSLYNSSQFNMSRLMGVHQPQTLLNPELLRPAATSLFSSHESQNLNFLQQNQLCNAQFPTPLLEYSNHLQTPIQDQLPTCIPCVSFSGEPQLMEPNVDQFSSTLGSPSCQLNEWQTHGLPSTLTEDHQLLHNYGYDHQSSDHGTSNFQYSCNNVRNGFGFGSVLSTPSSSPTTYNSNSNSTYVNNSCTTEDERESYCSNMLKFEISDILDVNVLM